MGCPEPPQSSTSSLTFSSTGTNCTVCFVVSGASCPCRGSAEIIARAISEIVELARYNRGLHSLAFICVRILHFAVIYSMHATCQDRAHNPLGLANRLYGNRVRIWETSVRDRTQGFIGRLEGKLMESSASPQCGEEAGSPPSVIRAV